METVNALQIRNRLGEILDRLESTGEPIQISKGRRVRAVLVSPEDFRKRFLDRQTEEHRRALIEKVRASRAPSQSGTDSTEILRDLRGYRQ
jgi:PHD/YefM family antitoxin component YafN of YafNO toxin-antitoxin module